jgi:hypothetical protein
LAVARGLVDQHGGSLEFKSVPRTGTTVTIFLPMKAKPCARLPYANRVLSEGANKESTPAVAAEPVIAGAR